MRMSRRNDEGWPDTAACGTPPADRVSADQDNHSNSTSEGPVATHARRDSNSSTDIGLTDPISIPASEKSLLTLGSPGTIEGVLLNLL